MLFEDALDVQMDFDSPPQFGSYLGSKAIQVMDHTVCPVWASFNCMHFYRHESCGQCTPCREGSSWMYKILERLENGLGTMEDIDLLTDILQQDFGSLNLCAGGFLNGVGGQFDQAFSRRICETYRAGLLPVR